jgi:hypothetical protein
MKIGFIGASTVAQTITKHVLQLSLSPVTTSMQKNRLAT